MADRIKAIKAYTPKLRQKETVQMERLVEYIAARTNFNEGAVVNVLTEFRDAVLFFGLSAQAVKLKGLGTFTPTIDLDGRVDVSYRTDKWLKNRLNAPDALQGKIDNLDMIGKTAAELVERWNAEHPEDPIEVPKPGKDKQK